MDCTEEHHRKRRVLQICESNYTTVGGVSLRPPNQPGRRKQLEWEEGRGEGGGHHLALRCWEVMSGEGCEEEGVERVEEGECLLLEELEVVLLLLCFALL